MALHAEVEPSISERVHLVRGDCASEEVWREHLPETTVVYASNLLFDATLNARLAERVSSCASVRAVASLKPFEPPPAGFRESAQILVETSWRAPEEVQQAGSCEQAGSLVYVYRRVAAGPASGP